MEDNGAEFSECHKYRYRLWRIWDKNLPLILCIGVNPSTADSTKNDPTINTLSTVLKRLGYSGFYMMNLFAFISPVPSKLLSCTDPVGADNDGKFTETVAQCSDVIFCWGNAPIGQDRIKDFISKYPEAKCFGFNSNGAPSHPLSLMYKGTMSTAQLYKYENK